VIEKDGISDTIEQDPQQGELSVSKDQASPDQPPSGRNIDALLNVELDVRIVLGRSRMPISELLNLSKGSVVELDRGIGDPVDVMINDRLVAKGDLVKVAGGNIGVALREVIKEFVPGD